MRPILVAASLVVCLSALSLIAEEGVSQWRGQAPADASNPLRELVPGQEFLPATMRAQQLDDFDNPAYPFVEAGERAWSTPEGTAGKSCESCHGGGRQNAIKGAAASYPKFAPDLRQVITLETRINFCRRKNLDAKEIGEDSDEMVAMVAYLRWLARGLPSAVDITGPNAEAFARGSRLFQTKLGLLKLSCAQCHNERYGQRFGGETLSQGHPLAYPAFKESEKRLITLHERFRLCNALARADGQPDDSPDYVALELYLDWRSKNLPFSAPGVRP